MACCIGMANGGGKVPLRHFLLMAAMAQILAHREPADSGLQMILERR